MKSFFLLTLLILVTPAFANTWSYQVNINGSSGKFKTIDSSKSTFEAGPYYCEVTPVNVDNNTEFRSLNCSVGTGTVSTGGLCTKKGTKFPNVQYAILNLSGPKNHVNIVVACKFD